MHFNFMGLLLLLLCHSGWCATRRIMNKQTSPPTPIPRKPPLTHISEFTDPDTGLNPFLDIEEGRVNDVGRHFTEEEEQQEHAVADLPFPDLEPQEGDASQSRSWPDTEFSWRRWWFSEEHESTTTVPDGSDVDNDSTLVADNDSTFDVDNDSELVVGNDSPLVDDNNSPLVDDNAVNVDSDTADGGGGYGFLDDDYDAFRSVLVEGQSSKDGDRWTQSKYAAIWATVLTCTMLVVVTVSVCWWRFRSRRSPGTTVLEESGKLPE